MPAGLPWADWQDWLRCLRERKRSLSVACLLLSLVLLVPAVRSHSRSSGARAFEQGSGPAALLLLAPERLTLRAPETRHVEAACPWPLPVWTTPAPVLPAVVAITPALPLPRGTSPFPLRV